MSAVLADDKLMHVIEPGTHGSTFGGNPLGTQIAITALQVLVEEDMINNAARMGELLRQELNRLPKEIVKIVRGKGLLNAIVIDPSKLKNHVHRESSFNFSRIRCLGTLFTSS